jgi:hypothetical protein
MRGWVCRLQLLLTLASAIIPASEDRGTRDHILLSQIPDFPNLEGQVASRYEASAQTNRKHRLSQFYFCVRIHCHEHVFIRHYLTEENFFWLCYSGLSAAILQYSEIVSSQ